MKADVYESITNRMIEALEQGTVPWQQPWSVERGTPRNLASGKAYRGINTFLLALQPFASPFWLTYKQAQDRGGQVRKGEKGTHIVFWNMLKKEQTDGSIDTIPLLRTYCVFNAMQCDGIEVPALETVPREHNPNQEAERIVAGFVGAPSITHGDTRAYYRPSTDSVHMPDPQAFTSPDAYYNVLFHELTHATGHSKRLDREGIRDAHAFGDAVYSKEELVAEMGAAFLSAQAGIVNTFEQSASYIASWLKVLRGNSKLVVQAAGQAQRAVDHILGTKKEQ